MAKKSLPEFTFPNNKHGLGKHPAYACWRTMLKRCYDPNWFAYRYYGARGVGVCARWRVGENGQHPLACFIADMGERPRGHSLDRKDSNKDYSPDNCRWANQREQCNNTRSNRRITFEGKTFTLAQWARFTGVPYKILHSRLRRGTPFAQAITTEHLKSRNQPKPVLQSTPDGEVIQCFASIRQAAIATRRSPDVIKNAIRTGDIVCGCQWSLIDKAAAEILRTHGL